MIQFFAYGSLIDLDFVTALGVRYEEPCSGKLIDFDFQINVMNNSDTEFGYANIIKKKNCFVEGVLMKIPETDFFLLDSYEGYPGLYSRSKLKIILTENDKTSTAWVYIGEPSCIVNQNLKLSKIQKVRINNGFPFLSTGYQNKLLNLMF